MTEREILQDIYDKYKKRNYSQYDIATNYGVSTSIISFLLCRLGFVRGKLVKEIYINDVLRESSVRNILEKMSCMREKDSL